MGNLGSRGMERERRERSQGSREKNGKRGRGVCTTLLFSSPEWKVKLPELLSPIDASGSLHF